MEDIIKVAKSLENSGLLLKGVGETIQNEAKEQKRGFLSMLLGTLDASLLGNILVGKGINRVGFLMQSYLLTNFEKQKYYQNEPTFNGVYSRDNLPKIKDGAYVIDLDEYSDIGTHWVALYVGRASPKDVQNNDVTYFDSFGGEQIPKEIRAFIGRPLSSALHTKNIKTNISRIQAFDSIMC